jgi:NAD(P)-dependent dehydrogenase (short-subunit alcohol dehydrogenase family)
VTHTGARVVITAGGGGIGACLARRFAAQGARVAYCDIDPGVVPEGMLGVAADVTDEAQMAAFFAQAEAFLGGVDVLCANAGIGGPAGGIADLTLEGWRATISANLDGAFLACRWAAPLMCAQGAGSIVLTSSTSGLWGVPTRSPYVVAKWGVIGLMKTLAMELGPSGVRVNAVAPGAVEGPRMERVLEKEAAAKGCTPDEMRAFYAEGTSLRTWVTADEIADSVLFLTSDAGRRISGQTLAVDGHTERMT